MRQLPVNPGHPKDRHGHTGPDTARKVDYEVEVEREGGDAAVDTAGTGLVSPLLRPAEAADRLGLTPRQLAALSRTGTGPAALRIGPRTVRYRRTDIDTRRRDAGGTGG